MTGELAEQAVALAEEDCELDDLALQFAWAMAADRGGNGGDIVATNVAFFCEERFGLLVEAGYAP